MNSNQVDRQQFWQRHIQHCQAMGFSGKQYCERRSLSYSGFLYWRRKLAGVVPVASPPMPAHQGSHSESGLVAVRSTASPSVTAGLELLLPNGWVVGNIQAGNVGVLKTLLAVL